MPDRTTIVLPPLLKQRAVSQARVQGISFAEFVRRAVEKQVTAPAKGRAKRKTGDPFLDSLVTFDDGGPPDLSTRVDEIVYGDM
jgi:hypothetical protein